MDRLRAIGFSLILVCSFGIPLAHDVSAQEVMHVRQDIPFELHIDQTALIESKGIAIKLLNVTEDSRCPSDVTCIWQGQVKTLVGLSQGIQGIGNFTLDISPNKTMSIKKFDSYFVQVIDVKPYPISTKKILPSDYAVTLKLSSLAPLKQINAGIIASDITCKTGFQLVFKAENGSPACVSQSTANALKARGWANQHAT